LAAEAGVGGGTTCTWEAMVNARFVAVRGQRSPSTLAIADRRPPREISERPCGEPNMVTVTLDHPDVPAKACGLQIGEESSAAGASLTPSVKSLLQEAAPARANAGCARLPRQDTLIRRAARRSCGGNTGKGDTSSFLMGYIDRWHTYRASNHHQTVGAAEVLRLLHSQCLQRRPAGRGHASSAQPFCRRSSWTGQRSGPSKRLCCRISRLRRALAALPRLLGRLPRRSNSAAVRALAPPNSRHRQASFGNAGGFRALFRIKGPLTDAPGCCREQTSVLVTPLGGHRSCWNAEPRSGHDFRSYSTNPCGLGSLACGDGSCGKWDESR
jgi:hypothetical protein